MTYRMRFPDLVQDESCARTDQFNSGIVDLWRMAVDCPVVGDLDDLLLFLQKKRFNNFRTKH